MPGIASVSLERPLADISQELGASFAEFGFAIVRDHGIPDTLIAEAEEKARDLFALPDASKRAYHDPAAGGARGYTPFGTEKAKDSSVHDLKEFWHVGRDLPAGHPLADTMAPNVWPRELPECKDIFSRLFDAFDVAGKRVLRAIAIHLGLDKDFFEPTVVDGNSVLRFLHYPPLPSETPPGAIRAAAHEDINTITLLLGAEEAGLELKTRAGEWLPINPPPGALVVNIGDMLQRLTNGRLRSTTHRVVNPSGAAAQRSRFSMPFFLHFRPDYVIETLASCIDPQATDEIPAPISSHDYLQERLKEIGLA